MLRPASRAPCRAVSQQVLRQVSAQNVLYASSSRFAGLLLALAGLKVLGLSLGFLAGSLMTLLYSMAF
jgi:hypothetical protein